VLGLDPELYACVCGKGTPTWIFGSFVFVIIIIATPRKHLSRPKQIHMYACTVFIMTSVTDCVCVYVFFKYA